jgi:alpha-glucosidase
LWVQDWTGRRENVGGGYGVQYRWEADEVDLYPEISAFVAGLHGRGYRVVGYINPFADPSLQHWSDLVSGGMLPLRNDGEVYTFLGPRGNMSQVDLSNPTARAYIETFLERAVVEIGLDGWMTDFSEWAPIDAVVAGGNAVAVHNRSPQLWQALSRDLFERLRPDGDWLMFARAGWAGVHGSAQITWVGDQEADWEPTDGLPTVVPAMLNLGMSGQGYVTHDIAGFSGGPSTPELYARWTELGALSPFMRTHDGNNRDENHRWDTDAETTAHFARMVRLHEALGPEFAALSTEFQETGVPILRHLMLEYPEDEALRSVDDQYLIGNNLLIAPILHEGVTERSVLLPPGTWINIWTGEPNEGPSEIVVAAPIGQPPVFSRGADRPDLRNAAEG